jgi:hypothetical protein
MQIAYTDSAPVGTRPVFDVVADDSYVYFFNGPAYDAFDASSRPQLRRLQRVPITGGAAETIYSETVHVNNHGSGSRLVQDATHLYFWSGSEYVDAELTLHVLPK